jgi:hypothetical protein
MENRIQQEIDKTLECMQDGLDIPVNPLFAEGLSQRMANMRVPRGAGHRSRMSYPVVIALLIVLNLATGLVSLRARQSANETSDSPASVLATEYGIGQSNLVTY